MSTPAPLRGPAFGLARVGTPVGILLRRWAAARHGLDLPHYACVGLIHPRFTRGATGADGRAAARVAR